MCVSINECLTVKRNILLQSIEVLSIGVSIFLLF